jgi:hypothetical protein
VRHPKHVNGDLAEAIAVQELTARGYWVFTTHQAHGPADIIALSPGGETLLLDIKKETWQKRADRPKPQRINRVLTEEQLRLGVRLCYVNINTNEMTIIQ